jgi:2-dehydropantoate 2-reductase
MAEQSRVLIVGCGGVGGVIAAKLNAAKVVEVHAVSTNPEIHQAVTQDGFRLTGLDGALTAHGPIHAEIPEGPFDVVLLATRPPQVEEAAKQAVASLHPDGVMVVLQNGLCEPRVAAIAGPERTVGGIVSFGASMYTPGTFELTARGGITLGTLDGKTDPRIDRLQHILKPVGSIQTTQNLLGARYSKLALNCAVSGLGTVAGVQLGTLIGQTNARNLALEIMCEVVSISRAEGIDIEPIAGTFDLNWLADPHASRSGPQHWARHAMLLAVGLKYRRLRSSMLRALERGRSPAVEFLNGEVVNRGDTHSVSTPYNQAVRDTVLRIAAKEIHSDMAHIETIRAATTKTA